MDTLLVTGGAGFVGSNLAIGIKTSRSIERIVALDNLKRRGSELNLPRLREAGVEFLHGDIRNPEDLAAVGPIDMLLECSAEPSVLAGYSEAPDYVVNTNLGGTVNCLEHARKHGAGLIFLSTSRVYPMKTLNELEYVEEETRFTPADDQAVPGVSAWGVTEDFPLNGARSLYGATKLCSEILIQEYAEMYGMQTAINRCGVISGPWQMGKVDQGVVVLWAARHFFKGELSYFGYGGTGKQVRDVLHIDDLLRLVLYQMERMPAFKGTVYNIGGGRESSTSLMELTTLCQEITGNTIPIASVPEDREADMRWYITNIEEFAAMTGWRPERDMRGIVSDVVDWLRANEAALKPILG